MDLFCTWWGRCRSLCSDPWRCCVFSEEKVFSQEHVPRCSAAHRLLMVMRPSSGLGMNITVLLVMEHGASQDRPVTTCRHLRVIFKDGTGFADILWEIGQSSIPNRQRIASDHKVGVKLLLKQQEWFWLTVQNKINTT